MKEYINDNSNIVPENTIVFYSEDLKYQHDINKVIEPLYGKAKREWFESPFYYCLPLTIANQYGFVVKAAEDIELFWTGGNAPAHVKTQSNIHINDDSRIQRYYTNFRNGILTVENAFMLRTPPKVNLMVIQPPNYFIPDISAMSGVVEADNLRRAFTFNIKVTKENTKIKIKKGDWLSAFIPIPRYFIENFEMKDANELFSNEVLKNERLDLHGLINERNSCVHVGGDIGKTYDTGRRYFKGVHLDDTPYEDHQKRI